MIIDEQLEHLHMKTLDDDEDEDDFEQHIEVKLYYRMHKLEGMLEIEYDENDEIEQMLY